MYTLVYGIAGTLLSGLFYLSIRIHIHLYGGLSLSSIVSFDQTPQILFYSSFLSLMSLVLFHGIQRLGDIGVMMAVGGNRLGCIWLHSLVLLILILPCAIFGFLLASFVQTPTNWTLANEFHSFFLGISIIFNICVGVSFPSIGLTTFIDPYRAIRRQR